jgi:hypothetical protein
MLCPIPVFESKFSKKQAAGGNAIFGDMVGHDGGRGCNCVVAATVVIAKSEVVWHSAK